MRPASAPAFAVSVDRHVTTRTPRVDPVQIMGVERRRSPPNTPQDKRERERERRTDHRPYLGIFVLMSIYTIQHYTYWSIRASRMVPTIFDGCWSRSFSMLSSTLSSVDVVSTPVNAAQSFATIPAPTTSDPRFTVPATNGTCNKLDSSSRSSMEVCGWTIPPWLVNLQ